MDKGNLYELRPLTPDRIVLYRSQGGMLQGSIEGTVYSELLIYRTFPLQYPDQYISVRGVDGTEIGVIENPLQLDEESRQELTMELKRRYFLPQVIVIQSIREKGDLWEWELETDAGAIRITMRNLHDHVQFHNNQRILLTDLNGQRCEIIDRTKLNAQSRKWLDDVL
ncbi:DUF1854 domain-containing protein [Cohnella abietis]|uniref:DUF1854 domain-containing protein n=1 Tax=Cohnella abietis TaxID=2507935 RepID=A0A3T1D7H8_9BACL|nr:DUF1854 domain-containing protein [Cohnella abietis]BBI34042.1 hypothetical protein KCTCHS21_34410 [Cohnella abietis]